MLGMGIGLFCCAVWVMYGCFVSVVLIFQWFAAVFLRDGASGGLLWRWVEFWEWFDHYCVVVV